MCSERIVLVAISVVSAVLVVMVMSIYFSSNEIDMGAGDDMSIVKESSGLHILEVDGFGPGDGQGWFWLELGFIILAIKLVSICSHGVHNFCLTKKIVKKN